MLVWIDQDLCTGCSLCAEIVPQVFTLADGRVAYVKEGDAVFDNPGGAKQKALVPTNLEGLVREAAAETPGECIFVELITGED
jgi:ferredoxin